MLIFKDHTFSVLMLFFFHAISWKFYYFRFCEYNTLKKNGALAPTAADMIM